MTSAAFSILPTRKRTKLRVAKPEAHSAGIDPAYGFRVTHRVMRTINKKYFRSRFIGFDKPLGEQSPGTPVIYASNHSGMAFPWDGIAMASGLFEKSGYNLKHAVRPIATPLLSKLPAMSPFLLRDFWRRQGAIDATMDNFRQNMGKEGVNLLIYPEGIEGIGKGFNNRYQVQRISTSMVRMSIEYGADIVLVATVGGEYINPWSYSFDWLNKLVKTWGVPFIPVGPSLLSVLLQPWMAYFAFPAKLTFVRGATFRPYDMVQQKSIEQVSEREIRDIRDKIHEQMQAELDRAVDLFGDKPFDLVEFAKTTFQNATSAHLFLPLFWPILFWENERHSEKHPYPRLGQDVTAAEAQRFIDQAIRKEWAQTPTLRSLVETVRDNPEVLKLYLPALGLWKMARGEL